MRLYLCVWLPAAGMLDFSALEGMLNNPGIRSMMQSLAQQPQFEQMVRQFMPPDMVQMAEQVARQMMGPRGPPQ